MHGFILYCLFVVSVSSLRPVVRRAHMNNVIRLTDDRRRSNSLWGVSNIPLHQPKVGGLHPGHTLLRPKPQTLKSAAKYPTHSSNNLVYGNPEHLNYFYKKKNIKRGYNKINKHPRTQHQRLRTHKGKSYIPRVGGLHPGHALLKPKGRTLESSATFPKDDGHMVYGNRENFGITYNKTNERVLYTGFRRMNDDTVDNVLLDAIRQLRDYKLRNNKRMQSDSVLVIAIEPGSNEIIDETSSEEIDGGELIVSRRKSDKKKKRELYHVDLDRKKQYGKEPESASKSAETSETSESGEYEKNPGNEYSLHKNRYKQNWLWNHAMTGDHMNINPYGPQINNVGPSGVDLFFGRKWWYFNQDDYKPLR